MEIESHIPIINKSVLVPIILRPAMSKFKTKNPTYFAERNKEYRKRDPLRYRNNHLKRMFGITLDEFNVLFALQGNCCIICGTTKSGHRNWQVDHCHFTNKVRGILCSQCNVGLGSFKDNAVILERAALYSYKEGKIQPMQINFSAYDYDPSQGAALCFPLADYKIEITAAEAKPVKDNPSSGYLELSLTVLEGELRGLIQKDRLNIFNTSEIAKRIAHQQLSAYCFAIGRPFVAQTEELIGGRCICTIGPQDGNDKYSDVKVVKMMDGSLPQRQGQPQSAQAAAPQAPPTAPAQQPPTQPQPQPQASPAWNQTAPPTVTATPWGNSAATAAPGSVPPWAK